MKAVILAGGLGTRFGTETANRPKPMIEVGGRPILWHIMKLYELHGVRDFVVCAGYRADVIADYFVNYSLRFADLDIDFETGSSRILRRPPENWRVKIIDTGPTTETGGRVKRIASFVEGDEFFLLTYGDTLTDVDVGGSIAYHQSHGRLATMSVVSPRNRFGTVNVNENVVTEFREKQAESRLQINAGFFVLSPKILSYIENDSTVWEQAPLENPRSRRAADGVAA